MYGNNYFMPYGMNYGMPLGMGLRRSSMVPKTGLLGRLGGVTGAVKGINWGGLLNNASRTLGVINQAIPVVKQAGPMLNNMKSMMRLATAFKNETSPKNKNINNDIEKSTEIINNYKTEEKKEIDNTNDYMPNFFIN